MAENDTPLKRGNALLAEGDHEKALQVFQEALQSDPSADAHEALARAYIKGERYLEAAEAALKAITVDAGLAKAYLRRGIALFHLDEFETALEAFEKGKELRPTLAAFDTWIRKCRAEIDGEVEEIEPPKEPERPPGGPKITFLPPREDPPSPPSPASPAAGAEPTPFYKPRAAAAKQQQQQGAAGPVAPSGNVPIPNKIRHEYYQVGADKLVVDVFAKALTQERFQAEFQERRLRLAVLPAAAAEGAAAAAEAAAAGSEAGGGGQGPEWELDIELFGAVDVSTCKFEILRTKVEVTLRKAEPGKTWPTLEKSDRPALPSFAPPPPPAAAAAAAGGGGAAAGGSGGGETAPAGPPRKYPSSYTKAPKDWSALEKEVKEMESKGELDEGDPLNGFFKKIFSQGDEDTRRAMMKSFVESNGTVLSTNWGEVGKKKVECTPPEGMEVHKWDE